jgi:hypothetical protein
MTPGVVSDETHQHLRGFPITKDYLTPLEAAEYACVPLADFEAQADHCGA